MFCFRKKKKKVKTSITFGDSMTDEDTKRTETSRAGRWNEMSGGAVGNVTGKNRHDRNVDILKDLLFRLHISVRRKFSEESKERIVKWQVCPKEIVQALEEIFNAHAENRYKDCLENAKATVDMIKGFEENKLPYMQELLAYTYCCMALTYVEIGNFDKVKDICPKNNSMATVKSLDMLSADDNECNVSVLYQEIAKCNLQVESRLYFPNYSRATLNVATKARDHELQLYAHVLFALIEEIQCSHFMAVHFIKRSLETAKCLKDNVAAVDIQNILRKVAEKQDTSLFRRLRTSKASKAHKNISEHPNVSVNLYASVDKVHAKQVASPFSSDDDFPPAPHTDSDSNDETEPKQLHMGTELSEETHLKMIDTGSTSKDDDTNAKVFRTAVGMSLPERLGPEGSSEPPSFHPAVSSSEEQSDSSSFSEETHL